MGGIASAAQLRVSYLRWALVTVPGIILLGTLSGLIANSGSGNLWFAALAKPSFMPPGWTFGAAWTVLYILMGLALAMILNARGARGRGIAIAIFLLQFLMNLCWSPLFFAKHQVLPAFALIVAMFVLAAIAAALFLRIRTMAGVLMLPYLAWLIFAASLTWQIHVLNPDAGLAPQGGDAQIAL